LVEGGFVTPGTLPEADDKARYEAVDTSAYLRLPRNLDPRIVELGASLRTLPVEERVRRLRAFFDGFHYTLEEKSGSSDIPLRNFLFEHHAGHCEYFATGYALLLRAAGIPSRVVAGFQGGAYDSDADLILFTGANAHAWVEWFDPRVGWATDDVTPVAGRSGIPLSGTALVIDQLRRFWDNKIVDFSFSDQQRSLTSIGRLWRRHRSLLFVALGILSAIACVVFWPWRKRERLPPFVEALDDCLVRHNVELLDSETFHQAAQRLPRSVRADFCRAVVAYDTARFGAGIDDRRQKSILAALSRL